jgi:hypothetical protein
MAALVLRDDEKPALAWVLQANAKMVVAAQ